MVDTARLCASIALVTSGETFEDWVSLRNSNALLAGEAASILCISNVFPLPQDTGEPLRVLGLLRCLAANYRLHVLLAKRRETTDFEIEALRRTLGAEIETFDFMPPPGRTLQAIISRWIRAWSRHTPPWIQAQWIPKMAVRAAQLARGCDAAVILDDYAGAYATFLRGAPSVVADKSNVMGWSVLSGRHLTGWRNRARWPLAVAITWKYERAYLRSVDRVVVTSSKEAERMRRLYGRSADAVVASAVEPLLAAPGRRESRTVGWLGALDYVANEEGLIHFVERSWDELGRAGCRLLVAGRRPSARVLKLESHPGVEVLGYVESLSDFLERLSAAVVPLWAGAGVKLKTLTFMGAGIPVVATPVALEGIAVEAGRHCLISGDPQGLALALHCLLADDKLASRIGKEGRNLVLSQYTWKAVGKQFIKAVDDALAGHRRESEVAAPVPAGR